MECRGRRERVNELSPFRVHADFNGLFRELLCLSHKETCVGADGGDVIVHEGMSVTAFDEDIDDAGNPDNLIASGVVERPPEWLRCNGSRWVLRIDHNGVRHESDIQIAMCQQCGCEFSPQFVAG
jgi:hypothetical protein